MQNLHRSSQSSVGPTEAHVQPRIWRLHRLFLCRLFQNHLLQSCNLWCRRGGVTDGCQLSIVHLCNSSGLCGFATPPLFAANPCGAVVRMGGLPLPSSHLGIHTPGMRPLVSLPARSQAVALPVRCPLTSCDGEPAANSEPIKGVHPSGTSTVTIGAMHDQLKAQHRKSWLLLIENAGSRVLCLTSPPIARWHLSTVSRLWHILLRRRWPPTCACGHFGKHLLDVMKLQLLALRLHWLLISFMCTRIPVLRVWPLVI